MTWFSAHISVLVSSVIYGFHEWPTFEYPLHPQTFVLKGLQKENTDKVLVAKWIKLLKNVKFAGKRAPANAPRKWWKRPFLKTLYERYCFVWSHAYGVF